MSHYFPVVNIDFSVISEQLCDAQKFSTSIRESIQKFPFDAMYCNNVAIDLIDKHKTHYWCVIADAAQWSSRLAVVFARYKYQGHIIDVCAMLNGRDLTPFRGKD